MKAADCDKSFSSSRGRDVSLYVVFCDGYVSHLRRIQVCKSFKESEVVHLETEPHFSPSSLQHETVLWFRWSVKLNETPHTSLSSSFCQRAHLHLRPRRGRSQRVLGSVLLHCASRSHHGQNGERPPISSYFLFGTNQMCCVTTGWVIPACGAPTALSRPDGATPVTVRSQGPVMAKWRRVTVMVEQVEYNSEGLRFCFCNMIDDNNRRMCNLPKVRSPANLQRQWQPVTQIFLV